MKVKLVLKLHILSGCDVTSKVGTKLAVMRRDGEAELQTFGENSETDEGLGNAERFLVKLIEAGSNCTTFNELRGILQMRIKVYSSNNNVYSRDNIYVVKSEIFLIFDIIFYA